MWLTGLVAPWHVGSSQTRVRTHVPCIGRRILNHCATREAQRLWFLLWLTIVPGRGFLYVCQGLRDLNFPTGAQGRKRKHLGFLTSLPDVGQRESRGMGPVRKETCKLSAVKYQNWSQMLYYTNINSPVITILVHTHSWDSDEMGF